MVSFIRITVLLWADMVAAYALWVMMTYLTNVWKLDLTRASAIVNVLNGASTILPIGMSFLVDTFMGDYTMLLLSSIAYSCGMGLLSMSTPPVLSKKVGNCDAYQPECIENTQKVLFYIALALIIVGMAGHSVSLGSFLLQQFKTETFAEEVELSRKAKWQIGGIFAVVLVPVIGGIALQYINPWSLRFGIPAIFTVVATFLFLTGSCSYKHGKPRGSTLVTMFRVIVATLSKACRRLPQDSSQLYEKDGDTFPNIKHTKCLRCLDKAAIIVPNVPLETQEQSKWRLCRVTDVEKTKSFIRMIPMWMTFIMCGVLSSVGSTYFLEQANHLNHKVGKLKVPLTILLMVYDMGKSQSTALYTILANAFMKTKLRRYIPTFGIAMAMVLGVLCCIAAAKVEFRRLDVVNSHGLRDKPDEKIPMTIFWLVPQFLLLGAFDGISDLSIGSFVDEQTPSCVNYLLSTWTDAVSGVGILGSVVAVYAVGKVSERGNKANWFQDTLNKSRLDKYYWTLAVMCVINLVVFAVVASFYRYNDEEAEEMELEEAEESETPFDQVEVMRCCCC